jgi:hypothetical protein
MQGGNGGKTIIGDTTLKIWEVFRSMKKKLKNMNELVGLESIFITYIVLSNYFSKPVQKIGTSVSGWSPHIFPPCIMMM